MACSRTRVRLPPPPPLILFYGNDLPVSRSRVSKMMYPRRWAAVATDARLRVQTVSEDSPAVKFFLANLPADDAEFRLKSTDLFGLEIEEAIIFRANRPNAKKHAGKSLQPAGAGSSRG